jgi:hypothetical protein
MWHFVEIRSATRPCVLGIEASTGFITRVETE